MWRWVNLQVLSWYVLGVSERHTRVTATTPTKLEKQTSRHRELTSTELWAWCLEQKWQLASGTHCSGTAVADPQGDPATNDIPTGALSNSQQLIQTGYIIYKLMTFIHHCCCKGTGEAGEGKVHPRTGCGRQEGGEDVSQVKKVKAVCGSYSTAPLRHIVLLPEWVPSFISRGAAHTKRHERPLLAKEGTIPVI